MQVRRSALLVLVALATVGSVVQAETFQDILGTPLGRHLGDALGAAVTRSLPPVIAASAGVTFTYDMSTGAFTREPSLSGQLFLERADPIGRERWNVSLSYLRVKLDRFEGEDIEALSDNLTIADRGGPVTFPLFGIDFETHELTGSVTYGVTDDLDLNLTIPIQFSEFRLHLRQAEPGSAVVKPFDASSTKFGPGDIFVRGKYRVVNGDRIAAALGLVLRLPAGNEDNFQGTGDTEVAPLVYLTGKGFAPRPGVSVRPYFNAGVNFDAADVAASEARWGLGLDAGFHERVTVAVAILGRHAFQRTIPAGTLAFPRTDGTTRSLFGIEGQRSDFYDVSLGGRVHLWRDTLFAFGNVLLPLNDDGVRALVIPTAGIEAAF